MSGRLKPIIEGFVTRRFQRELPFGRFQNYAYLRL